MRPPRLHVVTDDDVLARPSFPDIAAALARTHGARIALHLRGHRTPAARLFERAEGLEAAAAGSGAMVLVADRVDVALATRSAGVRLGALSVPTAAARALLGDRVLARSVHAVEEAGSAAADGADFLVAGTIWATGSHPGREGVGPALLRRVTERVNVPVVAIGGVTPERVGEALDAGAWGVAVLSGIWDARDPLAAATHYLEELR